ncbi:ScbA/BarX family gamma-butyrolactone biosynthesis protein [Streptomyces ziwulingensis]|uniref:ScbA/BarX family gamma-butyrolactone biosynthesis protein n=1 Tax=Streptomyces ziwulingensis TaxID=1045501 RepID=A0ABP9BE25_9ACTN
MNTPIGAAVVRPRVLSWSRTVPRELVHRVSVAEVLLTDVVRVAERRFVAAACWPRSHPTFPVGGPAVHDPLMVVETLRQLGIYIALRHLGVAADTRMLIGDLHFGVLSRLQPRVRGGATDVTCRVRITRLYTSPDDAVTGVRLRAEYSAGGVVFAGAGGSARFLSPGRYAAVRGPSADSPPPCPRAGALRPDPSVLGVAHPRDVLIAVVGPEGGGGREARVDPADHHHPFFFDHASDHVPGTVLLEAARQATALVSGGELLRLTGARLAVPRFTEYAPAARVVCVPHHRTSVFRFEQGGECGAFGVLRYHSLDRV